MSYSRSYDVANIPSASTTSLGVSIQGSKTLVALVMPSAFTGTTITFQASSDNGATWQNVYNESTAYSITVAVDRFHAVMPEAFYGVKLVRLVSGSAEAADRDITLVFMD